MGINIIKSTRLLFLILLLLASQAAIFPQSAFRRGIQVGMEFMDYLSGKNGSFVNEPGYNVGLFTGIDLYEGDKDAFILKIELNYNKLVAYRNNYYLYYKDGITGNSTSYVREDQRLTCSYIELGIIPEYFLKLNNNFLLGFYFGPSAGIGGLLFMEKPIEINLSPTAELVDYYDADTNPPAVLLNFNAGINLYYGVFFVSLRYKYSHTGTEIYFDNFNRLSLLGGLAFK